jgi:hypothetical protein
MKEEESKKAESLKGFEWQQINYADYYIFILTLTFECLIFHFVMFA